MEKLSQMEVWDIAAPYWNEYRRKQIPEVESFLKNKRGNVLDLGCGSGRLFIKIKGTIYGVDFSKNMLKFAKERAEEIGANVKLIKSSLDKLPLENNFFDSAIYIASLHCIEKSNDRKSSLQELFRVLKPKARALIRVWSKNHERVKNNGKEQYISWTINGKKYLRYYYIYDKDELESLLKEVGFKIISSNENDNIVVEVEKAML